MIQKKQLKMRIILIVACLSVCAICIWKMDQRYDPLARYAYVTDENRDIILKYLDSDDIDYLVTQHITPDDFMEFIKIDGFEIKNTLYYRMAKDTQDAQDAYIVNFVNRFRTNFTLTSLEELLTYYSYLDLTTFYENEAVLHSNVELIANPENPYLILNEEDTIYKYVPNNLVEHDGYMIKSCVVEDLDSMLKAYASVMDNQDTLSVINGYESYESIMEKYLANESDILSYYMYGAGQNEQQLGYTVLLNGYDEWNQFCIENDVQESYDYNVFHESLSEEMKNRIEWLEENAYRYGFIIRYPKGQENKTGHWYQPYLLRYVGKETAKAMHDGGKVMEQMHFSDKLE